MRECIRYHLCEQLITLANWSSNGSQESPLSISNFIYNSFHDKQPSVPRLQSSYNRLISRTSAIDEGEWLSILDRLFVIKIIILAVLFFDALLLSQLTLSNFKFQPSKHYQTFFSKLPTVPKIQCSAVGHNDGVPNTYVFKYVGWWRGWLQGKGEGERKWRGRGEEGERKGQRGSNAWLMANARTANARTLLDGWKISNGHNFVKKVAIEKV